MRTRLLITLAGALLVGTVMLNSDALAQGGGEPPDYGDLIILYRDDLGRPITTPAVPEGGLCQQPIAFRDNVGCPAEEMIWDAIGEVWLVPTNPTTCSIAMDHATCTNEADFGRTNLARSSDEVLASQLDDVIVNLAIADCTSLDPAGRMVYSSYIGEELVTGTIDSPLQNLAVYKQLTRNGTIGVPLPRGASALSTAARGFGVAMDKAGAVNIDLLVYLNETLGLTVGTTILGEPICIPVREEVAGVMQTVQKCFLDYSNFVYDRATNFGALPSPAYIGDPVQDGMFEFLMSLGGGSYMLTTGLIFDTVFESAPGFSDGKIGGFAQAADDTRAVINFMHNWPVPGDGETTVPCNATPNPTDQYDLSISERSGLKVPRQVTATTEGREFVVTVENAGPDTAAGTLTVTATAAAGGDVLLDGAPGPWTFEFVELQAGMSFTTGAQYFTIAEPHVATKISWTAIATPRDVDPYMGNNAVTATSNVKVTGGGGH